jgi:hypothetical protein
MKTLAEAECALADHDSWKEWGDCYGFKVIWGSASEQSATFVLPDGTHFVVPKLARDAIEKATMEALDQANRLGRRGLSPDYWRTEHAPDFSLGPTYAQTRTNPDEGLRFDWLRWGLEEIVRCTEPKAGSGDRFICGIASEALTSAGFGPDASAIQKPARKPS